MGLVNLKYEFEILSDLKGTAANARYFLRSINLSPYGYDFRTIRSWSLLIENIKDRLAELKSNEEESIEQTELGEELPYTYETLSMTWIMIEVINNIKDSYFKKYRSIFNNILSVIYQRFNKA